MSSAQKIHRIGITGGRGFIGSHLVDHLIRQGYDITLLMRKRGANAPPGTTATLCDLLDTASVQSALPTVDAWIHLASHVDLAHSMRNPTAFLKENPVMLMNLLEVLRTKGEHPRIVFASTDRVYGMSQEPLVDENTPPTPIEPYTASKMLCEIILQLYGLQWNLPFIILRFDSIYGPGARSSMFIGDVLRKLQAGDSITVGSLDAKRNFAYVDDCVDAVLCALHAEEHAWNAIYNIGGEHASLREVLEKIIAVLQRGSNRRITVTSNPSVADQSGFEARPFRLSTERAGKMLHWRAKISLDEGLEKTIRFILNPHEAIAR